MAIPYKCPICNGTGLVPNGFYRAIGVVDSITNSVGPEQCKSCNGTGIVWDYSNGWNQKWPLGVSVPAEYVKPPIITPCTGDPLPPNNPTICGESEKSNG
jgi:hypothetical protein